MLDRHESIDALRDIGQLGKQLSNDVHAVVDVGGRLGEQVGEAFVMGDQSKAHGVVGGRRPTVAR